MDAEQVNTAMEYRPSLVQRITGYLFPHGPWPELSDRTPLMPGWAATVIHIHLSWGDRIRSCLSGHLVMEMRQQFDVPVRDVESVSSVRVVAPWDSTRE